MQSTTSSPIFTTQFWLLSLSSFLFFASFNMLIPELPRYLTSLGGADYKGHIIALFTLTAGLSRPFSGRLTDKIGRIPVMAFGSLVCFACGFLYPVFTTVFPFLLLRMAHGFSTGFKPTGTAAYIADIIPAQRRGEALGIHGLYSSIGAAIAPAAGSWIAQTFSLNVLFYTSSFLALISIAILLNMKETLAKKEKLSFEAIKLSRRDVFEPGVFDPSLVIFLTYFSFGAVATLTPDFSEYLGFENRGLYFFVSTIASLLTRLLAGKVSDRHGRVPVATVGCSVVIVGMVLTACATSQFLFLAGAFFYGISMGILSPILSAWTVDLSDEQSRGRSLSTMYLSMEAGIGLGAWLSASLYANQYKNFPIVFGVPALLATVALVYCMFLNRINKHPVRTLG